MKIEDLTLEIELRALDELFEENEHKGDDIRDAIQLRRKTIKEALANSAVERMLIEHLQIEFPQSEPTPDFEQMTLEGLD